MSQTKGAGPGSGRGSPWRRPGLPCAGGRSGIPTKGLNDGQQTCSRGTTSIRGLRSGSNVFLVGLQEQLGKVSQVRVGEVNLCSGGAEAVLESGFWSCCLLVVAGIRTIRTRTRRRRRPVSPPKEGVAFLGRPTCQERSLRLGLRDRPNKRLRVESFSELDAGAFLELCRQLIACLDRLRVSVSLSGPGTRLTLWLR